MTTHRTLVIGVGSIGERHLRCFKSTNRTEVGLVELNPKLRDTITERYGVKHVFNDLDSALNKGFDTAVICTPAQLHIPMATRLVEAGQHVLIEKPLSINLDGIDKLREAIARKKATVGVAYVWRSSPALASMKEAIESGRFGKPVQAVIVAGQHFPTFRPAYRDIYYKDRKMGGGAIQDALTHMVNATEWLIGPIDRLTADAAHQVLDGVTVEDTVHVVARHGPIMASYSLNQYQALNETILTVNCERGIVRFEAFQNRWRWITEPNAAWNDVEFGQYERDTLFINQANYFLDAVEGKRPVTCTLEQGEQTLRVNLAILAAADRGSLAPVRC